MDCRELDLVFKESEQRFSDTLIQYKTKATNAYWGKIPNGGEFPRNSGTTIKINKLGRSTIRPTRWQSVEDSLCNSNACDNPVQDVIRHGYEQDEYSLAKTSWATEWLCLETLTFREMPGKELENFEDQIRRAAAYTWEEFGRSRFIQACGNKCVAIVGDDDLTDGCCDTLKVKCNTTNIISTDGFRWARHTKADGSDGEINQNYVFVNVDPEKIPNIAEMSLDLLDYASQELVLDDDSMPFLSEGIELMDVILANERIGNRFAMQEDRRMNNAISYGGYQPELLKKTLGTKNTFRDRYSVRYDNFSARFYPDTTYNDALVAQEGYAYDAEDPETWPRFERVYEYIERASTTAGGGVISVPNKQNYIRAPFAISTVFSRNVCEFESYPEAQSYGSAKLEGVGLAKNYAGRATWRNPDWPCNPDRNKGFWKLDFGAAVRPNKPELGWSFFHRVDHRIALQANCCAIPDKVCHSPVSPYCFDGVAGDEASLNGTFGQIRPIAYGTSVF